jgi:hypothetical protein
MRARVRDGETDRDDVEERRLRERRARRAKIVARMEDEFEDAFPRVVRRDERLIRPSVRVGRRARNEPARAVGCEFEEFEPDALSRPTSGNVEYVGREAGHVGLLFKDFAARWRRIPKSLARSTDDGQG